MQPRHDPSQRSFKLNRKQTSVPKTSNRRNFANSSKTLSSITLWAALLRSTKFSKTGSPGTGEHLLFVLVDEPLILMFSYDRPRRILKTKPGITLPVAASGFRRVANLTPPLCPHAYNGWCVTKDCEMVPYRETIAGKEHWVFCARQHKCDFKGVAC